MRGVKVSVETMRTIPGGSPDATFQQSDGPHFLPDRPASFQLGVMPGPGYLTVIMSGDEADQDRLAADQDSVAHFDPVHYANGLVSNDKGEHTLPSLIPGATYRIYDSTMGEKAGPRLRKEFTVKAGETLDLGDVLNERPMT